MIGTYTLKGTYSAKGAFTLKVLIKVHPLSAVFSANDLVQSFRSRQFERRTQ